MNDSVLHTNFFQQRKATKKLVEESRADADFYLFLCASVFITTLGLIIDNLIVIVGAILVAPMLYPILALGLGVVTTSAKAINRALAILGKSVGISVAIALLTSFLVGVHTTGVTETLRQLTQPELFVYFLIASAAGVVASFAWATQETTMSLPGVAITVSLVPPLAAIGISLALLSRDLLVGSIALFITNLLGIVLASVVVFSLFGFQRLRFWQEQHIKRETDAHTADAEAGSAADAEAA